MKDIRVDSDGEFRCWNCGNKGLLAKRTFRSKMLVGVGALLTKKKLKCQTCGEYNDTGNAKPYTGPEARKWRKQYEKVQASKSAAGIAAEQRAMELAIQAFRAELADEGAATIGETAGDDASLPSSAGPAVALPPVASPAAWQPDPTGRHQLRYWDGIVWSPHVSDDGVQTADPLG